MASCLLLWHWYCIAYGLGSDVQGLASAGIGADGAHSSTDCVEPPCHQPSKGLVHRQHPNVVMLTDVTTACSAKFVSLSSRPLDMYW